jgi:hypothetical protein
VEVPDQRTRDGNARVRLEIGDELVDRAVLDFGIRVEREYVLAGRRPQDDVVVGPEPGTKRLRDDPDLRMAVTEASLEPSSDALSRTTTSASNPDTESRHARRCSRPLWLTMETTTLATRRPCLGD